ncbi:pilus assembly protein [Zobellella maritima]|uniref:pilus assembly protein n=1 Tax=Zobellella maritima TaxID=2059725 RepID=UPI000E2FFE09|nr:pilus assembly protein [Zobellella maritima]
MEQTFLVYSHNKSDVEWLRSALAPQQVLSVNEQLDDLLGLVDITGASLVFVGLGADNMVAQCGIIEGLLEARPFVTVVGLGDGLDNQLVISAMRAGARDFIIYGMRSSEVQGLVRRLSQRLPQMPVQKKQGELMLIYGAQPDADAALIALHLALGAQQQGESVLLLDLGIPFGESLEGLGLNTSFYFGDALRNLRRLDASLIDSAFCQHDSGLKVLAHDGQDGPLSAVHSTELYLLLGTLRQNFGRVIVNLCGQPDSESLRTFISNSQCLYWYIDQSVSCCKRSLEVLSEWRQRGIKLEHSKLLIDRYIASVAPDASTLASSFHMPLASTLPSCPALRLQVKNQGRSLFQGTPRNPLGRALQRLTDANTQTVDKNWRSGWMQRLKRVAG